MASYPITTKIGLHNADNLALVTHEVFPSDGGAPIKWLDLTIMSGSGASHSEVQLTIHAGRNPALWQRLCDLADAWRDAGLRPEPTAQEEEIEDERLRREPPDPDAQRDQKRDDAAGADHDS